MSLVALERRVFLTKSFKALVIRPKHNGKIFIEIFGTVQNEVGEIFGPSYFANRHIGIPNRLSPILFRRVREPLGRTLRWRSCSFSVVVKISVAESRRLASCNFDSLRLLSQSFLSLCFYPPISLQYHGGLSFYFYYNKDRPRFFIFPLVSHLPEFHYRIRDGIYQWKKNRKSLRIVPTTVTNFYRIWSLHHFQ